MALRGHNFFLTMTTTTHDFTLLARAGLYQTFVAEYLGVSRVTVNAWVKGTRTPSKHLDGAVTALLAKVQRDLASGALPGPKARTGRARRKFLQAWASKP